MGEIANGNVGASPPHAQLIQMGMGFIPARVLYLAAKMGLADLLADEPKSAAELAGPTGTHPRTLHRLMRTLSSLGVFTEGEERTEEEYAVLLAKAGLRMTRVVPTSFAASIVEAVVA